MATVGGISRHYNLAELAVPRDYPSFQTVATRQAEARANLGMGNLSLAELAFLDGATAGTAVASKVMVTNSANGIGGFRDTRSTPVYAQGAAGTLNATGTLTAALMLGGIVTSTSAAGVTATLDTAANLDTALLALYPGLAVGDFIEFSIVNTGPNSVTIATAAGWTDGGNGFVAVATATSARFGARRTGANAYTLFKLA